MYISQANVKGDLFFVRGSPDGIAVALGTTEEILLLNPSESLTPIRFQVSHISTPVDMATNGNLVAVGYETGLISVWSMETAEVVGQFELVSGSLFKVAFNYDGALLAGVTFEGEIRIWEVDTGRLVGMLNQDEMLTEFQFSPDGSSIALLLGEEIVEIRKMETEASSQEFEWAERTGPIYWIEFDNQWEQMVWVSRSSARLQNLSNPEATLVIVHEDFIHDTAFSPDGSSLAASSAKILDGEMLPVVQLWNTSSGLESLLIPLEESASKIEYSADGSVLFVGLQDGDLRAYDPVSGEKLNYFPGHNERIAKIIFLSEGTILTTISNDGEIRIWAVSN
jgi:WD40 repeat protein